MTDPVPNTKDTIVNETEMTGSLPHRAYILVAETKNGQKQVINRQIILKISVNSIEGD